ncbi:MAG: MFS transporter [Carboxydocellales bacterium]
MKQETNACPEVTLNAHEVDPEPGVIHYGIWVLLAGVVTVFGCLGLGRFAMAMILPSMRVGLGLNYSELGLVVSAAFAGYLGSTVLSGFLAAKYGSKQVITVSMVLIGIGMLMTGRANGFALSFIGQLLAGIGAGGSNVPVMGLVARWFAPARRGMASGFMVMGSGIGLVFAGLIVPLLHKIYGANGWRVSWMYLGAAVLVIAILGAKVLRNGPEEMGLKPIGGQIAASGGNSVLTLKWGEIIRLKVLWQLGIIYFMFGFSYVTFTTFFASFLVNEKGFTTSGAGQLWALAGLVSVVSGFIWGTVSDYIGRKWGLAIVYSLQALSLALLALSPTNTLVYVGTILYALTIWSIPAIMNAASGDYVGGKQATAVLGLLTIFFGMGQMLSPSLSGVLRDYSGSFSLTFGISALACLLGAGGSMLLKKSASV